MSLDTTYSSSSISSLSFLTSPSSPIIKREFIVSFIILSALQAALRRTLPLELTSRLSSMFSS
uniref:Uncharacterized protein n=1 Tax=Lepeophtheirus salmonis TaxID=72036 RepID=A0A0K2TEJ7_LEPSM